MILLGHIFVLLLRVFGPFCVLKTVFKVFSVTISNQGRWSFALVAFDAGRAADVYFAVEALFYIYLSLYLKHYYNSSVTPLSYEDQRFPKERRKRVLELQKGAYAAVREARTSLFQHVLKNSSTSNWRDDESFAAVDGKGPL